MHSKKELLDICTEVSSKSFDVHDHVPVLFFAILYHLLNALLEELELGALSSEFVPEENSLQELLDVDEDEDGMVFSDMSIIGNFGADGSALTELVSEALKKLGCTIEAQEIVISYDCCQDGLEGKELEEAMAQERSQFDSFFGKMMDSELLDYFSEMRESENYWSNITVFHAPFFDKCMNHDSSGGRFDEIRTCLLENLYGRNYLRGYDPVFISDVGGETHIVLHYYADTNWWADEYGVGLGFLFALAGFRLLAELWDLVEDENAVHSAESVAA